VVPGYDEILWIDMGKIPKLFYSFNAMAICASNIALRYFFEDIAPAILAEHSTNVFSLCGWVFMIEIQQKGIVLSAINAGVSKEVINNIQFIGNACCLRSQTRSSIVFFPIFVNTSLHYNLLAKLADSSFPYFTTSKFPVVEFVFVTHLAALFAGFHGFRSPFFSKSLYLPLLED
jgi:hypothetical protein